MNQSDRQQLSGLIERLEAIQAEAPARAVYTTGRTSGRLAYRLLDVIADLKAMIGEDDVEEADE